VTYEKLNIDNKEVVLVYTDKFKTININISYEQEFANEKTAARALLARLLRNSSKFYPSKRSISMKLQDLYDAKLGVSYNRVGRASVTNFSLTVVNDEYLHSEDRLLAGSIAFLNQVINHPNVQHDTFSQAKLEEERRLLLDEIKAVYNNKGRFALNEMIEAMFATELYGKKVYGTVDQINQITVEDVYEEYMELVHNSKIYVYAVGDIEKTKFLNTFDQELKLISVEKEVSLIDDETKEVTAVKEIIKQENMNQSKLNIGFRTDVLVGGRLYYAMLVLGSLLGGHTNSRFFQVVREEHSLAYHIGTIYGLNKGVMVVTAGIDAGKYHQVMDLIMEEINKINQGIIDLDLIELTKISLNNELLELFDSPSGMVGIIQKEIDFLGYFNLEKMIRLVAEVTKEEIVEACQTLILDTIYLLSNKEVEKWKK